MNFSRRSTRIVSLLAVGLACVAAGGGVAAATPPTPEGQLTWMSTQNFQVGDNGPTVIVLRQVGDQCTEVGKHGRTTTILCTDISMALLGSMIEIHANREVAAEVTETKTGSISNELDYHTWDSSTLTGETGTLPPGASKKLTAFNPDSPDWYLDLDGKLGNSGTARITLTDTR